MPNLNASIHNWLVAGGSSDEGHRLLLKLISNKNLRSIFAKKAKHHEQIIRTALAHRIGFKKTEQPKFRDEFPFLNAPDCPFELKILAANKLTAFYNFKKSHAQLFNCTNNQEQFLTAKFVVENFIDNQLIWKELQHYNKTKTLLGLHPVFKELNRIKSIRQNSPIELVEKKSKLEHNIWRIESQLSKGDKPHLQVDREKRLQLRKNELAEIERLIESYR